MRIVFVRHGEPDYVHDSLTEKGWREAELLSERLSRWRVSDFYCSPLGRARDTASFTLQKMNRTAVTLDWMKEFAYDIEDPVLGKKGIPWDFVPSYWSQDPFLPDAQNWTQAQVIKQNPEIEKAYREVCESFDHLLASYGYERDGMIYRMPKAQERFIAHTVSPGNPGCLDNQPDDPTEPVIVIFCHLGITCLVLSHLLNISFPALTQGFFLPTTSLTILSSEERWSNEAYFRVQAIGDVGHLLQNHEPVSSAGSFTKAFQG